MYKILVKYENLMFYIICYVFQNRKIWKKDMSFYTSFEEINSKNIRRIKRWIILYNIE